MAAPDTAAAPATDAPPFALAPGGTLADVAVARELADYEMKGLPGSRGAPTSVSERIFAARCRSVVLIVAATRGEDGKESLGTGTGALLSREGYVLTAAHVVAGASKIAVGAFPTCEPGAQPEPIEAKLIKVDEVADLALLQVPKLPRDPVLMPLGRLDEIRTGSTVMMIGHPKGLLMSMSQGLVSAIRPNFRFSAANSPEQRATVVQTDGAINPGNSGGPMLSPDGNLVGVNSFILGQASAGLNFAVSIDDVRAFLARRESRMLKPAADPAQTPSQAQASGSGAAQACKPKVLKEWKEDGATYKLIDLNCSGKANAKLVIPEDPARRTVLLWDRNGDGQADARYYLNREGKPEYSEWDDDFDGTYDYRADHEGGEWEPRAKVRIAGR
jgi:S1-C subfamily serine protease